MSYKTPLLLLAIIAFLIGADYIAAQWTAPSAVPPNNNVAAPVNVSATAQTKLGLLGANQIMTNAVMIGRADLPTPETDVAVTGSMAASSYCDENGQNCFTAATGPGGGGDSITVGGRCFQPAWAVTCNWNWSGDGNDNSTYIRPIYMNPTTEVCRSVNRSYQYHNVVLAECTGNGWYRTSWVRVGTTNNYTRTVQCMSGSGATLADSQCPAPKPAETCTSTGIIGYASSGSCPA